VARLAKFLRLSLESSALLADPRGHETGLVARQGGTLTVGCYDRGLSMQRGTPGAPHPRISCGAAFSGGRQEVLFV
jgi:hypothetical protein